MQSCYLIVGFVANIAATDVVSVIISVWDGADGQVAYVGRGWMGTGAEECAA